MLYVYGWLRAFAEFMLVDVYVSEFACLLIVLSFGLRLVLWLAIYCGSIL